MTTLVHLTTLHTRTDLRVVIREAQTLATQLPNKVTLVVADGLGHADADHGNVSVHDIGSRGGSALGRIQAGTYKALAAIRNIKPEVIHFHDPELIPLGMVLRARGYKVIYDVHEDVPRQILTKHWVPRLIRHPLAWLVSVVEWVAARMFTAVVPATPTIAARFPPAKTTVIYNYPGLAELTPAAFVPYDERPPVFTYIGEVAEVRGITEVIQAFDILGRSGVSFELAGDISPAAYAEDLKRQPGWRWVNYRGRVSRAEVANIMARVRAGLVVHRPIPNEVYALPMKLFEYMNLGLPVIASDFPPIRAIFDEARCGLLVNPLNPAEIADAMRWILEHPQEAREMGERGRAVAIKRYNWNSEASKIVDLYRRILGHR